jgi:hypothetical protein
MAEKLLGLLAVFALVTAGHGDEGGNFFLGGVNSFAAKQHWYLSIFAL